jgi:large subunit ribosomal protein L25
MANPTLSATIRAEHGKNACRRLRASGRVPAILYGTGGEPASLSVNNHEFQMIVRRQGTATIISLQTEGQDGDTPCVIREILRDPVSSRYLHVDLQRVDMTAKSNFNVELVGHGQPKGVREGGVLETLAHSIDIRCLPGNLPHRIEVDLTNLGFHESIHAGDLKLPEGVELHVDASLALFTVITPRALTEEAATPEAGAAAAAAEPEVIGKKKEEGAEAEA